MKLLVYGSNGWIGSQFVEIAKKVEHTVVSGKSRLDNIDNVRKEVKQTKPTQTPPKRKTQSVPRILGTVPPESWVRQCPQNPGYMFSF